MADTFRPIPRRILALFLTDHESIKAFEELQQNAGITLPNELLEIQFEAGSASAKAEQALGMLERIAHALEMLATAPATFQAQADLFLPPNVLGSTQEDFPPAPVPHEETRSYGDMYTNTPQTVVVAAANTAYEIASGLSNVHSFLMTFGGAHYLSAERGGVYEVNWSMSIATSNSGDKLEGGVMLDGAAQTEGLAHGTVSNANAVIEVSGTSNLTVAAGQQLSLYVINHSAARDITIEHVSFVARLIDRRVV